MPGRLPQITARLLRFAAFAVLLGGLGGLAYWVWHDGQKSREENASRELSVKEPPRRAVDPKTQEVVLQLDEQTQQRLGLALVPLQRTRWQQTLVLPGSTVVVPHRMTEVRSPWTEVLEGPPDKPMPILGQKMPKGQVLGSLPLAWTPSDHILLETQLRDARGTILETEAQIRVAKSSVERLRKVNAQVVASKVLIEAEGNLAQLEARLDAARGRERDLRGALAKTATGHRFQLTVPQDGQLIELNVRPGEVVATGSVIARIYDPRELWIAVLLPPGQMSLAEPPDAAQIRLPGMKCEPLPARLVRVKTEAAPQQQGMELIYAAANPGGLVPVGLQAEARLRAGRPEEAVAVPESAVVQWNGRWLIYVQRGGAEFAKQFVEIEGQADGLAYLRPTLPGGAKMVVARGAQTLLSEEYKESIQLVEESPTTRASEAEKPQEKAENSPEK